jgi:hypothetical protein
MIWSMLTKVLQRTSSILSFDSTRTAYKTKKKKKIGGTQNHRQQENLISFVQPGYLEVTVQEKLRSGWAGPFVKVEGCCY